MGTVPIGTGEPATISARMRSMSPPVERSITVSAPCFSATRSLRSSPSASLVTALLPMFALTLHASAMPMPIGSRFVWFTLAGMTSRPRATSSRTSVGVDALSRGDVRHFLRDDAFPGIVHLGPALIA